MIDAQASIPLIGASPKREAAINRKRIKAGLPPAWSVCRGGQHLRCTSVDEAAYDEWWWVIGTIEEYGLNPEGMVMSPPEPCTADGRRVPRFGPDCCWQRKCYWPKHPLYWGWVTVWESAKGYHSVPDASLHMVIQSGPSFASRSPQVTICAPPPTADQREKT